MHATDGDEQQDRDKGKDRPHIQLKIWEVWCLVGVAATLGAAVGYLIADHTSMSIAARVLVSDAVVLLPGLWFAIIVTRRLARIEAQMRDQIAAELAGYNHGYLDGLKGRGR